MSMRMFNKTTLGFLPHEAWGGGPDGDGTDLYGDTPRGVNAEGNCVDPNVHRQGPDRDRAALFMAAEHPWRRPHKEPKRPRPEMACPAGYAIVETFLTPTVIRRRAVLVEAQAAAQ